MQDGGAEAQAQNEQNEERGSLFFSSVLSAFWGVSGFGVEM